MVQIRDNFGALICMADADTGLIEHEYKRNKLSIVISVGQQFVIQRENKTTTVVRTREGFIATSILAA